MILVILIGRVDGKQVTGEGERLRRRMGRRRQGAHPTHPVNRVTNRDSSPSESIFFPFVSFRILKRAVPGNFARLADRLEFGEATLIQAPAEIIDYNDTLVLT